MDNYYRDFNSIFTFDYKKNFKWFGTSPMTIYYAMNEIVTNANNLDINKFYEDWYVGLKGTQYVVRTNAERDKLNLQGRGFLMPFVQSARYIKIELNELFYICRRHFEGKHSILNSCQHQKVINLNSGTLRELNSLCPDFTLSQLDCWKVEAPF